MGKAKSRGTSAEPLETDTKKMSIRISKSIVTPSNVRTINDNDY